MYQEKKDLIKCKFKKNLNFYIYNSFNLIISTVELRMFIIQHFKLNLSW